MQCGFIQQNSLTAAKNIISIIAYILIRFCLELIIRVVLLGFLVVRSFLFQTDFVDLNGNFGLTTQF